MHLVASNSILRLELTLNQPYCALGTPIPHYNVECDVSIRDLGGNLLAHSKLVYVA